MYDTNLCNAMSHSMDHFVTLDAKLWVALKRSGRAIRAAKRIFIRTFDAIGCNLPGFSFSSRVGRAIPASVNGVATTGKSSFWTFASSQYASTHDSMKEDMSYLTRFTGLFMQPDLFVTTLSMLLNRWDFFSFLASLLSLCGPGLFFDGRANWLVLPYSSPYLKIVLPVQKSFVWIFWSTVMSSSTIAELSSDICMLRTGRPLNSTFLSNIVTRSECKDLTNSPPSSPGSNNFFRGWRWYLVQVLLKGSCCQKSFVRCCVRAAAAAWESKTCAKGWAFRGSVTLLNSTCWQPKYRS